MTGDNRGLPGWALGMVFALALVAGAALTLLVWGITYAIPVMRATGGL